MSDDFEQHEPEPSESDDLVQRVLRDARAHAQPQSEELANAFAGLHERLRAPHADTLEIVAAPLGRSATPHLTAGARFAPRARLVGWTALAAALGFYLGTRYERARTPERTAAAVEIAPSVIAAPVIAAPAPPHAPARHSVEEPVSTSAVAPLPSAPVVGSDAAVRPANARGSRAKHSTPRQLDFRQVLELLRRAERARQGGSPELALALLDEIDHKAARHVLREERVITRTLALCDSGEDERARASARELGIDRGVSIYTSRLSRSCAAQASSEAADDR
jgi:hypothetical protein